MGNHTNCVVNFPGSAFDVIKSSCPSSWARRFLSFPYLCCVRGRYECIHECPGSFPSSFPFSPPFPDGSPGIVIGVKRLSCCMPLATCKKRAACNECKMTSLFYTSSCCSPRRVVVSLAMNRERNSEANIKNSVTFFSRNDSSDSKCVFHFLSDFSLRRPT